MNDRRQGGEPDGARLLALARRELLESLLPQLQGESRYRARLIANAMKLAAAELEDAPPERAETLHRLRGLAAAVLPGGTDVSAMADPDIADALAAGLRAGRLDGRRDVYALLERLTEERRRPLR
jgi:hypothetical protein